MVIDTNHSVFLILVFLIIIAWIFYGLYLRGMIFGRYNELKGNKNKFNKKYASNFLEAEYIHGIFWFLGIKKMPYDDKVLKRLIFKQRIWFILGVLALIIILYLN